MELSEWAAYDQIEPFGEPRADLRAGIITATIANANRDPEKHSSPFTPDDFMPKFDPPAQPEPGMGNGEELLAKMRAWMPPPEDDLDWEEDYAETEDGDHE